MPRIDGSCLYRPDNGCCPSRSQLVVQKRKSGAYTRSINKSQIKTILTLQTGEKVPPRTLRKLLQPLFPPGHSMDYQFLYNFQFKAQRMLTKRAGAVDSMTITQEDETMLVDSNSLDAESPEYYTASFRLINQLIKNAILEPTDILQIERYLDDLAQTDTTFKWRKAADGDGKVFAYIWQNGIMRRDFELCGPTLFLDSLGRSLNNKGWPLMTIAMLSGEKSLYTKRIHRSCGKCAVLCMVDRGNH